VSIHPFYIIATPFWKLGIITTISGLTLCLSLTLSFLIVTATFVSTENANGNQEGVQDAICQALFVGMLFAFVGAIALVVKPDQVLSSVLSRKWTAFDGVVCTGCCC